MNYKSLISVFILVFISFSLKAEISDYLVGLKAYKDGFYDIAKDNLENYLSQGNDEKNKIFAHYVLANIYFEEKDYKNAIKHINEIENKKDERIKLEDIRKMKIYGLVNINCEEAKKYLAKYMDDEIFDIYFQSACKKDDEFINILCESECSPYIVLKVMYNLNNFKGNVEKLFSCLDLKNINDSDLKDLGLYFYKVGAFDYFWKIYDIYRDDILVNLALERLWFLNQFDAFLKTFQENREKYVIERVNYCRAIKVYNDRTIAYDCAILKGCLDDSENLHNNIIACYLNKREISALNNYLKKHSSEKSVQEAICSYGTYIISEKIYDKVTLNSLSKCVERIAYVKLLAEKGAFKDILYILNKPRNEEEYFYIALAYKKLGENIKFEEMKKKIKNVELLESLNNY